MAFTPQSPIPFGAEATTAPINNIISNVQDLDDRLEPVEVISNADTTIVATSQTTTSTSFTDLATAGPAVTAVVPASGKVLLSFGCHIANSVDAGTTLFSIAVSGANTVAAAADSIYTCPYQASANGFGNVSKSLVLEGLNPGSTTFTCKYAVAANTGTFRQRYISVVPLP